MISNPWTHSRHGHSALELERVSRIINSRNAHAEIASIIKNHRWIPSFNPGLLMSRLKLDHSKFFYSFVQDDILNAHGHEIERIARRLDKIKIDSTIVITSCKLSNTAIIENISPKRNLLIRFLDYPLRENMTSTLMQHFNRFEKMPGLACATRQGAEVLKSVFQREVQYVPEAMAILDSTDVSGTRDRIGILWPVAFAEERNRVMWFMEALKDFKLLVRFPGNFNQRELEKLPFKADIKVLERGVTNDYFYRSLSSIQVGVLPHVGYSNRSSGLASMLAAMQVPIIANSGNLFYKDLQPFAFMRPLTLEKKKLRSDVVELSDGISNKAENMNLSEFTLKAWQLFLGV